MERNLRLYPWYCTARGLVFWLPVFFLYFSSKLSVSEVLTLEAIYYLSVVLFEIPSGYLSDRVGRRPTLVVAMGAWACGCAVFAATGSFGSFAVGQVLLALGMAMNSGTDSSLLYDSLRPLDKTSEFSAREGTAQARALTALGMSALIGGLMAGFDLRWAYVLSALGAITAMGVAFRLKEPPRGEESQGSPWQQLTKTIGQGRNPVLRWLLLYTVGMTVLNHVPYELLQPWIDLMMDDAAEGYAVTPAVTGVAVALTMVISAAASRKATGLEQRFGLPRVLVVAVLIQMMVIGALAIAVHPVLLVAILCRSIPGALYRPLTHAAIHPHLESGLRATWLSIQSFVGRLAFAGTLAMGAWWTAGAELDHPMMRELCLGALLCAVLLLVVVATFRPSTTEAGA